MINKIESSIGIKFTRIGAPQPEQLIEAAAENVSEEFDKISEQVIPYFKQTAEKLILEKGAEKALCLALAKICGYTTPFKQKSLLSSSEGFMTLFMKTKVKIYSPSFVLKQIGKFINESFVKQVREIKVISEGAILDVPFDAAKILLESNNDQKEFIFEECKELPKELEDLKKTFQMIQ